MNPVTKLVPKAPKYLNTVNLYRTRVRDPSDKNEVKSLGWEPPWIRVANTVTWLLQRAKVQGLTPREKDNFVCVQDLLQHPNLVGVDFPTLEKAVRKFRTHKLKLTCAIQSTSNGIDGGGTQLGCWWIGLQKYRSSEDFTEKRVVDPREVPLTIYEAPSKEWPNLRDRGISRGDEAHISLKKDITIPFHYIGDNTFIRLNSNKVLSEVPLYNSRTTNRKGGTKTSETITTPAQNISPDMFETAMRVSVQRFPLILKPEGSKNYSGERQEDPGSKKKKREIRVMKSGVDVLRKYGFDDVVESSGLGTTLREQEGENVEEVEGSTIEDLKAEPTKVEDGLAVPVSGRRSQGKRRPVTQSTKDPPPHPRPVSTPL